jgi:glycerol-3-phosphate acyltransferase PlsY
VIFILCAALILLIFIKKTRSLAALLSLTVLAVAALSMSQTYDPIHQGAVAIAFGIWLLLCSFLFRMNENIDRLRIHKG